MSRASRRAGRAEQKRYTEYASDDYSDDDEDEDELVPQRLSGRSSARVAPASKRQRRGSVNLQEDCPVADAEGRKLNDTFRPACSAQYVCLYNALLSWAGTTF